MHKANFKWCHRGKETNGSITNIPHKYTDELSKRFEVLANNDEERSPNDLWEEIKSTINDAAQQNIPKRQRPKNKKWISNETLLLIAQRRELENKDKTSSRIKDLTREIRAAIRKDQNTFIHDRCNTAEWHNKNKLSKYFFKTIIDITEKPHYRLGCIKDENGKILTTTQDVLDIWCRYCKDLYKRDPNIHRPNITLDEHENEPDILISEVKEAIKKLRTGKSAGNDNIEAELLKNSGPNGTRIMHKLCNTIWKTNKWPEDRCTSIYVPLPKKGDTRECKNNRTISLISHASKILLYIIAGRLKQHLERELPNSQAGFRTGRGTRDQIFNIRRIIEKAKEKNQDLYLLFID